ncbi:hypothetical protein M405DRAFT_158403 [Rhizopogon salebrosus TDB-379]|nr:hypothetical protein M405DRAFT_158403 [Rhizopogon salebrosus TDB-379]
MDFKIQMMGLSHFNCQPSGKIRYKRLTRRTTSPQLSDIILYSSFSVALVTGGQALKCQGKTILYPPLTSSSSNTTQALLRWPIRGHGPCTTKSGVAENNV